MDNTADAIDGHCPLCERTLLRVGPKGRTKVSLNLKHANAAAKARIAEKIPGITGNEWILVCVRCCNRALRPK